MTELDFPLILKTVSAWVTVCDSLATLEKLKENERTLSSVPQSQKTTEAFLF